MSDREVVIKIPEDEYIALKNYKAPMYWAEHLIAKGTPLPKGHGRLIDAGKLLDSDGIIVDKRNCHYIPMLDVYQAPTIIEAERRVKNDQNNN